MHKSKDPRTQEFIESVKFDDESKYRLLAKVRKLVFENYPKTSERIMYGGIIFTLNDDFGGVFVYKNHISFEFSYGFKLKDPKKVLDGNGKYRRHLKLKTDDKERLIDLDFFLKQIKKLDE